MIITEKLYKGEDKLVVFDLTDKNDNPVNFTDLLAVSVRILINKKPFEIYSSDSVDDKYKIFEVVEVRANSIFIEILPNIIPLV